jgi:hypothetical protein
MFSLGKRVLLSGLVAAAALGAGRVDAAILSLDFNGQNGPTETGFTAFSTEAGGTLSSTTLSQAYTTTEVTSGTVTVAISSGSLLSRDRVTNNAATIVDSGAFTYAELYRDFFAGADVTNNAAQPLDLSITGLNQNTPYSLTLYALDATNNGGNAPTTFTFTETTGGASNPIGTISETGFQQQPTSNGQFSLTVTLTSDSTGQIKVRELSSTSGQQKRALLNGIELSAAVPEPGSVALLGLAGATLLRRRR